MFKEERAFAGEFKPSVNVVTDKTRINPHKNEDILYKWNEY